MKKPIRLHRLYLTLMTAYSLRRRKKLKDQRLEQLNSSLWMKCYTRGVFPYLGCLTLDNSNYIMRDVHEGACGNHSRVRSLVHKIVRAGYYWPFMQVDAEAYVKACDKSQCFSNVPRRPSKYLTLMVAPWPFA